MGDGSSGSRCGKRGAAGIGEQIQHLDGPSGLSDFFGKPVPVNRLFREKPGMLKAKGLQLKGQGAVTDAPLLGQIEKFPFAAALFAPVVMSVSFAPADFRFRCVPDDLGIGAYQNIASPALKLLSGGTVYYLIILPMLCNPHRK